MKHLQLVLFQKAQRHTKKVSGSPPHIQSLTCKLPLKYSISIHSTDLYFGSLSLSTFLLFIVYFSFLKLPSLFC